MRFNELMEFLSEDFPIEIKVGSDYAKVNDICLLGSSHSDWKQDTLYVSCSQRIPKPPNSPLLLLSSYEVSDLPADSAYALFHSGDLCNLFNRAKELILQDLRLSDKYIELARMSLSGANVSALINEAASIVGNALILVDSADRVLAHSTNYEIMDPLWAQNVERGYCSYEFVQKVRANREMQEWSKLGSETQLITLPGDLQPKLVARVEQEGHVAGALVMVAHHTPIRSVHPRQLPLIGKVLFDAVYRDSATAGAYRSAQSIILYDLLDERDSMDIYEYISAAKVNFPEVMQAVTARYVHHIDNRYIKRTFALELERIFPKGHSVQYKSYIGILVPSVSSEQREALGELASKEDVCIGISWPFCDLGDFKRHFYQAVTSIKQAQRFGDPNRVLDYTSYACYDLYYNYTGKIPLSNYCHPSLQTLKQYDEENHTELYRTLRTYLEMDKNLNATAAALYIHRNTLHYRINRIVELTNLDLKDQNVTYSLMDSFRIRAFLSVR
jgi:hypothetical protein